MSPDQLAALHREAMAGRGPAWSARDFQQIAAGPGVALCIDTRAPHGGFALVRATGPEAELLALAVAPAARRRGLGRALLRCAIDAAISAEAREMFLEVSEINTPAIRLYEQSGFRAVGKRPGYYLLPQGRVDARIYRLSIAPVAG